MIGEFFFKMSAMFLMFKMVMAASLGHILLVYLWIRDPLLIRFAIKIFVFVGLLNGKSMIAETYAHVMIDAGSK